MFDTESAKVDISVGNAARISRLPGTLNRKGENTPDRPHRRACVVSYPDRWEPINHGALVYRLAVKSGYLTTEERKQNAGHDGDRPELLIDDAGVHKLIAEYPEDLHYSHTFERSGITYFALRECPFVGRAHNRAAGKSAITLSADAIGYSCFSDDCAGKGWRELKKLLHERTGRWPRTRTYASNVDPEQSFDRELNDYYRRMEHTITFSEVWRYDHATWQAITSGAVEAMVIGTDPAEWGLNHDDLLPSFRDQALSELGCLEGAEQEAHRKRIATILRARDLTGMGGYLGKGWLYSIARGKQRPLTADELLDIVEDRKPKRKSRKDRILSADELIAICEEADPFLG